MNRKTDNGDRKHPKLCKTLELLEERECLFAHFALRCLCAFCVVSIVVVVVVSAIAKGEVAEVDLSINRWQWHHGGCQFCVLFPSFFWRFFCYVFLLLAPWWTRRRKRPRARWPPGRRMWSISSVVFVRRLWSSFLVKWRRSVTKLLQKRFGSHVCVLLSLFALFFSSALLP